MREQAKRIFQSMQDEICSILERLDGAGEFNTDRWERTDKTGAPGGGGVTRVIKDGNIFEKGGVNFSEVFGMMPEDLSASMTGDKVDQPFYATGTSLVIHPLNPAVPTIHANCRYLEVGDKKWFGGGIDLTPYVLFEEDLIHFHETLKKVCDRHDTQFYEKFKRACDEYFYLRHRRECRGVGGIFFDYLGGDTELDKIAAFVSDVSSCFDELYSPIVSRRQGIVPTTRQKEFQLFRRGRYVEFNLLFDRGTLFGLKTDGRIESILMSLPPLASWEYSFEPEPGSQEATLMEIFRHPRNWAR